MVSDGAVMGGRGGLVVLFGCPYAAKETRLGDSRKWAIVISGANNYWEPGWHWLGRHDGLISGPLSVDGAPRHEQRPCFALELRKARCGAMTWVAITIVGLMVLLCSDMIFAKAGETRSSIAKHLTYPHAQAGCRGQH